MKTQMPDEIWVRPTHGDGNHFACSRQQDRYNRTKYVRADAIEALRQENAALKEKLDLCSKWQPTNTVPKDGAMFIGFLWDGNELSVSFVKCLDGVLETPRYSQCVVNWLPLPEGTEGL